MLEYKYNLKGGSLISIKVDNIERQYIPMENSWTGQDVVIFPFIARLKNGEYTHNGVKYSLKNHGLARYNEFVLESKTENSDTLLFKSNLETLKQYPFDFELRVTYSKEANKLNVKYNIKNTGTNIMPFGIGAHPAIKVNYENNDTLGNYLLFNESKEFTMLTLDEAGSFITGKAKVLLNQKEEMSKAFFRKYKTLMLETDGLNEVTLLRKDGKKIVYRFNSKYLALWSFPNNGDYVCVEPWDSLPDFADADSEIMKKKSLIHLNPNEEYDFSYSMEFID